MIKFHYHRAVTDVPRLGIRRGDRLCHVYIDASLAELLTWGQPRGLKRAWLDTRADLPHYDAFRNWLRYCGEGVSRKEFVRDVRRWRRARRPRATRRNVTRRLGDR